MYYVFGYGIETVNFKSLFLIQPSPGSQNFNAACAIVCNGHLEWALLLHFFSDSDGAAEGRQSDPAGKHKYIYIYIYIYIR